MTADAHPGSGDAPFAEVDAKLTIYALANGMDLDKRDGARRLSWFSDGLERGILLEADSDGSVRMTAVCWKTGDESTLRRAETPASVAVSDLSASLTATLEPVMEAANGL